MVVMKCVILYSLLGITLAGRAPYLGGDMQSYIEMSKRPSLTPRSNRPVTPKQLADYKHFQSKFSDIAKAYSEGYKAAIQAVQARAVIARQRLNAVRSKIPGAPVTPNINKETQRANIAFMNPVPNLRTVTGTERSGIPNAFQFQQDHNMVTRSTDEHGKSDGFHTGVPSSLLTDDQRNEISRLNAAALNKNHYLDSVGIDTYGGNGMVLTKQNWTVKKHKRNTRSAVDDVPPFIRRQRRSRMPYLGQNLDRLGVVRVVPNWDDPPAKKKNEVPQSNQPSTPSKQVTEVSSPASVAFISKPVSVAAPVKPVIRNFIPQRSFAAQPQGSYNNYMTNNNVQRNNIFNPYTQYQQASSYQMPAYPASYFQPYFNAAPTIENSKNKDTAALLRTRKSASPEPDVAAMNYAARHRNVYLDSISGDPYSGGSTVLSRQYLVRTH